jgi:hypothetical protein
MAVWPASNLKKGRHWPLLSAEGCHTLTHHSAELFAGGRRALKAVKALLRPNFNSILAGLKQSSLHGPKRGFTLVAATVVIFPADLQSFLLYFLNVHFPITQSSIAIVMLLS